MFEVLKNYCGEILSVIAIFISIIALCQTKKIHNDNKKLSTQPDLDIQLLFDHLIKGSIEKIDNSIDSFHILKTPYSKYYTQHDLHFNDEYRALFTVLVKNIGNGVAKNIKFENISIIKNEMTDNYSSDDILFSCDKSEIKANKIFISVIPEDIIKIVITITYEDILHHKHILINTYKPISTTQCELQLINSINKKSY